MSTPAAGAAGVVIEHGLLGTRVRGLDPTIPAVAATLARLGFRAARAGYHYLPPELGQARRTQRVHQLRAELLTQGLTSIVKPHPGTPFQPTPALADHPWPTRTRRTTS